CVAAEGGAATVVNPADLQAGCRRDPCAATGERADGARIQDPADLGRAALHDAAAVLDQPHHEDRHYVKGHVRDGLVDARLLENSAAAARRSRRREHRDLGRAAQDASGLGDPKRLAAADVTLDEVQETVSNALDVGLLRYARGAHIGTGGFVETPNQ